MRKFWPAFFLVFTVLYVSAQRGTSKKSTTAPTANSLWKDLQYRFVGPFRGGRSGAVTGSFTEKNTFFFGATGGGVWKTADGGSHWKNISDGYFGGSIGAVAVAPSNENIIYVGEGENTLRGNVSQGLEGMWRSEDGGRTWKNIGLADGRHIIRILIHPRDPNTVWVAVIGHMFGPNSTRGVYKTTDGGKNWKKVLYVNEQTGCSDLVMEPDNPNVLYAGMWRVLRTPYSLESGGEGSGLWKSTDGGETWSNLTAKKGLPSAVWGIVGVAVAPSNPDKVYAIIENAKGGLFASDDGGERWELRSSSNDIRQRAWYYSKVFVDPSNENLVYCPNVNFMVSTDGGKTFKELDTPHGDHHDLWIDPKDGHRMVVADDGGAQISFNGGESWSTYMNQPTAQIYRVSTDNSFPYRILGAQQDNSTIRIKSRTYGSAITQNDWEPTAGAESGYVVADPLNPDIVYGGNYGGYLSRLNHITGENRAINVWPDNPMGAAAADLKYRFQWNFPIFFSPHDPKKLYAAGNVLFATTNEGASWTALSGDLTTNDKERQRSSGGPITQDNTSVEYYCTIFTATESWLEKDLLWTGSDDGLIHVSRDAGQSWKNVTPPNCPKWMMWNSVEVDPFKKGTAYFAGTRYKSDDFTPYLYKTEDYGATWSLITNGIPPMHFTRVVRADHKRPGLLYAGTEYGMYISFDDGKNWEPFQLNLPDVPITDLTIKNNDLVVATQGRAFWVLDDLTVLQEARPAIMDEPLHVFSVNPAWRISGPRRNFGTPENAGANPPAGAVLHYYLKNWNDTGHAEIKIFDSKGMAIDSFTEKSKSNALEPKQGMNEFVWDMRYPGSERVPGMILWNGVPGSVLAPPGEYSAQVKIGQDSVKVPFRIDGDPNYKISPADYLAQFTFLQSVKAKFDSVQKAIKDIRSVREQLNQLSGRWGKEMPEDVKTLSDSIQKSMTSIEEALYQTKAKSFQDVLNYPIRLNDKIAGVFNVANSGNTAPSQQAKAVFTELAKEADLELDKWKTLQRQEIPAFNKLVNEKSLPVIGVEK